MKLFLKIVKWISIAILSLIVFVLIIFLSEKVLSGMMIEDKYPNEKKDITIYLKSNGVHTDIVLPVVYDSIDWSTIFLFQHTKSKDTVYSFVSIGWGDKGFYLNTPEWSDLTFKTAFIAVSGLGETALHVTYYQSILEDERTKKIMISEKQFHLLTQYILDALEKDSAGRAIYIETDAQYGNSDAFYEAVGSYSMFKTCNTWTNNALKYSGIPCSYWVAFESGIIENH